MKEIIKWIFIISWGSIILLGFIGVIYVLTVLFQIHFMIGFLTSLFLTAIISGNLYNES